MGLGSLSFDRYLEHLVDAAVRFDATIAAAPPTVRVPACPAWDRSALREHQAGVLAFWTRQLADDATPEGPVRTGIDHDANTAVATLAEGLAARLSQVGASRPCWNWSGADQVSGWVARRMAQEISVHLADAESITGDITPIADDVAADGIDELLDVFVDAAPGTPTDDGVLVELCDPSRRASLTLDGAVRADAAPEAWLGGTASDVLLALWSRPSNASWSGDQRAPGAWLHLAEFE